MDFILLFRSAVKSRKRLLRIYQFISVFGILLILSRQFLATNKTYLFLMWNFFLAGLPLIVSSIMIQMSAQSLKRHTILGMGCLWLVFLPNAPYMLTDYIHVLYGDRNYLLLDAFTLSWFAIPAFIAAIISLNDVSGLLLKRYNHTLVSMMVFMICLMCSFGIYLGRDLRFNSWDVIINPGAVFSETMSSLSNPSSDFITWISAMLIGLFLFFGYQGVKLIKSRI